MPLDEDGHWYRVLPAVAKVLHNRISATAAAHLHLAACRVFIAAGQVEDAIEQALCAGQPEVAANYLEHLGQEWLTGEQHLAHLLAWRSRLPALLLESTPRLLTLNAWALLLAWRLDEAEDCIHKLGRFLPQADARRNRKLLANWQALHGVLGALRGRPGQDAALHASRPWNTCPSGTGCRSCCATPPSPASPWPAASPTSPRCACTTPWRSPGARAACCSKP